MAVEISFHGAAGTVTGSRHLLRHDGRQTLVDAGLFQGLKSLRLLNWDDPGFDPAGLSEVILTHAHIDHTGYLPRLVRQGFSGPVHCTEGTLELARILLPDCGRLQEEDAAYANRRGYSRHRPALPLFTEDDAFAALRLLEPHPHDAWVQASTGLRFRFHPAGHILGSAILEAEVGRERSVKVAFSGDLGRFAAPLHVDPAPCPACDVLVLESTYGDRRHDDTPFDQQVREPLRQTLEAGGVVLVPAFAVGRTQVLVLLLRRMMEEGSLPEVPIHVDSPMAVSATRAYANHVADQDELDDDVAPAGARRLFPRQVLLHRSVDESKALNHLEGPRIIVSASGMCTAGRILHHLVRRAPDPRNLVLLVGYQAAGTRGRAMVEGASSIRIHGQEIPFRARFHVADGLSGHADADELVRWVDTAPRPPRLVLVTHGEPAAAAALGARLQEARGLVVRIPSMGQGFVLDDLGSFRS